MELTDAIRRRRMCRDFAGDPVDRLLVDGLLDLARRAPSGGFTQGCEFVVLEGPEQTATYWDVTLPAHRRATFPWPGLLRAPVLVIPFANPQAYVDRYSEADKAKTGLGAGVGAWTVPYWFIDAGMAAQNLLLAAFDAGLGALLFGIFDHEVPLLRALGVPDGYRPIGTVALGHPTPAALVRRSEGSPSRRPRRPLDDLVHRGRW